MDKNKILQFVAQLQELRDNVEDFMYFSTIPVEHLEINFNEGMDRAVEAVLFLYGEIVLDEIQRKTVSTYYHSPAIRRAIFVLFLPSDPLYHCHKILQLWHLKAQLTNV